MKIIFALLTLCVSSTAFSACYQIYSPSNELVWRGTSPPVSMDTISINEEVNKMVPKGHLVISSDAASPCFPLDFTVPRKTMKQKVKEMKNN